MSDCTHPTSALYVDRQRGVTHCTLCGDVVVDQQFELDPIFSRGGGVSSGGGAGGGTKNSSGGSVGGAATAAGAFRPTRGQIHPLGTHARPTIENARRGMSAIARTLELSDDMVEMALGVYKMALSVNAVSGARHAVLCACLYAICRREKTPHVIYDFAALRQDSPHVILSHMRHICEATHTEVPTLDIACLVQRFAEQMNLGDALGSVMICSLKVLRAMHNDWIACGRRPMGVCAAALLVACAVFQIPRSPEEVCGLVRLTAYTIARRLSEFALTPAAALESIDDYRPSSATLPPAFNATSRKATEEEMHADMRALSSTYYELVAEAKESALATPERCAKWRWFITHHCALEQVTPQEVHLDLTRLAPEAQLRILGLPHTQPIPRATVEQSVKRETEKLWLVKRESSQPVQQNALLMSSAPSPGMTDSQSSLLTQMSPDQAQLLLLQQPQQQQQQQQNELLFLSSWRNTNLSAASSSAPVLQTAGRAAAEDTANAGPRGIDFNDPAQLRRLTERYTAMLNNAEVRGLRADFDFAEEGSSAAMRPGATLSSVTTLCSTSSPEDQQQSHQRLLSSHGRLNADAKSHAWPEGYTCSPSPQAPPHNNQNNNADNDNTKLTEDDEASSVALREAVEAMMHDGDRRHALPWQIVILQVMELEDSSDILHYIILDNEERLRRAKVGVSLYREKWNRGRVGACGAAKLGAACSTDAGAAAGGIFASAKSAKRRRHVIERPASVSDALERVLRGRGAATVHAAHIHELLPGLMGEDDENGNEDGEPMEEWS